MRLLVVLLCIAPLFAAEKSKTDVDIPSNKSEDMTLTTSKQVKKTTVTPSEQVVNTATVTIDSSSSTDLFNNFSDDPQNDTTTSPVGQNSSDGSPLTSTKVSTAKPQKPTEAPLSEEEAYQWITYIGVELGLAISIDSALNGMLDPSAALNLTTSTDVWITEQRAILDPELTKSSASSITSMKLVYVVGSLILSGYSLCPSR